MTCTVRQPSEQLEVTQSVASTDILSDKETNIQTKSTPGSNSRTSRSVQLIPHLKEFLAFLIADDVPEVRAVLMSEEAKLLRVRVVVDVFDFDVNEKIYDREERLMEDFADLDFDFTIITQFPADTELRTVFSR